MVIQGYRKDIDGLRAIAVMAVIIFHFGFLPYGYLGVDVFFVISGYLITKIVYREALDDKFSIVNFYLRRIRRIIPLVLFTVLFTLVIGIMVMLPNDLENLSQSVIATNFFSNNVLLLITTGNYWDTVNEFKPLMHTWSLGVEEQFYFIFPVIFLFLSGKRKKWILPVLILFTTISLFCFVILSSNSASKFYLIQFRFFELSIGGIGAIVFKDLLVYIKFRIIFIALLIAILGIDMFIPINIKLFSVILITTLLLISKSNNVEKLLFENRTVVFIGKISFSLYMWHQIILAFARYSVFNHINLKNSGLIFLVILIFSSLTYFFIETPFRDKTKITNKSLLIIVALFTIFTTSCSFYIYSIHGVIRDVPELEVYKSRTYVGNLHIQYNDDIYKLDKPFTTSSKTKILVIGNSFSRDWANILLESKYKNQIEISYVYNIEKCNDIKERIETAKFIYFSEIEITQFNEWVSKFNIDREKVWNIGTKNFGSNNGIFYNQKKDNSYCLQKTVMDIGFLEKNNNLKKQWGERYIDLVGLVIDKEGNVPVFTSDCKFISQDCRHFTKPGAQHFSKLLEQKGVFPNMGIK
jgi:peptidoglycan/LPS O-acetylase OafA/YrhL